MKITLRNEFHGTEVTIRLNARGKVHARTLDRAAKKLCGMKDCACVPVQLNGDRVVDVTGKQYDIE